MSTRAPCWKYDFLKMLIKSSIVELETWDQYHFVMDGYGFPQSLFPKKN